MPSPTEKRSYAAGFFQLSIDHAKSTSYLKTVEGGWMKTTVMDERYGSSNIPLNHTAGISVDPISFEFGLAGAQSVLQWIKGSWERKWNRRNGQIDHADFDCNILFEHEFVDALILETTFPTLDGSSKEAGYLKCKIQPENVVTRSASGSNKMDAKMGSHQKLWLCSCFRLTIDGIDEMRYVNKIESFTVKQGVKPLPTGNKRLPKIEPTKIEFPKIKGSMSLAHADPVIDWYQHAVQKGKRDSKALKTGTLEFLAPNRKDVLFRIDLWDVAIANATIANSTANADQIKRLTFELSVGRMSLDGRFGFDG